jgi:LPS O-antigen subunit length determinant protein (WzzB/FepE family)
MPVYEVLHKHVGRAPSLNAGDKFDSGHADFKQGWDIPHLLSIGAIKVADPDAAIASELAGQTDQQLRQTANALHVADVAKLTRPQLAKAIQDKQALSNAPLPAVIEDDPVLAREASGQFTKR